MEANEMVKEMRKSRKQCANFMALMILELIGKKMPSESEIEWVERKINYVINKAEERWTH